MDSIQKYQSEHREELLKYYKGYNKKYWNEVLSKRPFKEIAKLLMKYIDSQYGKGWGNKARFAEDLIRHGIIKTKWLAYHWVNGDRKPGKETLDGIKDLLRIDDEDFTNLEELVKRLSYSSN